MKVLQIIASLIVLAIPTISLIQCLWEFKKTTKGEPVGRKACMTFVAENNQINFIYAFSNLRVKNYI